MDATPFIFNELGGRFILVLNCLEFNVLTRQELTIREMGRMISYCPLFAFLKYWSNSCIIVREVPPYLAGLK